MPALREVVSARIFSVFAACFSVLLVGCAPGSRGAPYAAQARGPVKTVAQPSERTVRVLPMFSGATGEPVNWDGIRDAIDWADIIIIGEQHDDAIGHGVQLAVVEDAVARHTGVAVSLEMLERDEQVLVDDYFEGIIDVEQFTEQTFSAGWSGDGSWAEWYQPIIDAAKNGHGSVVAANAPRRYVRLARTRGHDALRSLPADRRAFVELPKQIEDTPYRQRFIGLMSNMHAGPPAPPPPATNSAQDDASPPPPAMPSTGGASFAESLFLSQIVWDTTMGASIANAKKRGATKVIHLVGQFHSDFDGGTVLEVRRRLPRAHILVISMQRAWPSELRAEDQDRADIVIYTGTRPAEPDEAGGNDEPMPDVSWFKMNW